MVEASPRAMRLSASGFPVNPIQEAEETVLCRLVLNVKTTRIHAPSSFASAANCKEAIRISTIAMLSPRENRHFAGSVTVHMSDILTPLAIHCLPANSQQLQNRRSSAERFRWRPRRNVDF